MTSRSRKRLHNRGGSRFTPASLAGLAAWYRADLGVTLSGGTVSAWADQSGNARHVTQGVGASQPGWSASDAAYGNQPVLTFDGGDWLDAIGAWNLVQPLTIYVVGQAGNSATYSTFVDAGTGSRLGVRSNASEALSMFAPANIEPGASVASPSIICAVFNGASSAGYVSNLTASLTGDPSSGGLGTPRIGAGAGAFTLQPGSKIAEIIYTNVADSIAQRAQMFAYLSQRYALAVTGL